MIITVDIDKKLLKEAMKYTNSSNEKYTIKEALSLIIEIIKTNRSERIIFNEMKVCEI